MIHGSLFSGIGGFDLAAEWMGWENAFHCELNPFGQKVLKYYWPNATQYNDITQADFSIWNGKLDILTGGFPCQPFSVAGKREGKADERHLWPEMLRCIRECKPRWIVGENVPGLISWNEGMVFNEVWSDLESEGYEVQPIVLPACAKNAPHRRDRVWIVAYRQPTDQNPNEDGRSCDIGKEKPSAGKFRNISTGDNERIRANNEQVTTTPTPPSDGHDAEPTKGNIPNGSDNIESGKGRISTSKRPRNERDAADTESGRSGGIRIEKETAGSQQSSELPGGVDRLQYAADTCDKRLEGGKINGSLEGSREEWNEQSARFFRTDWQDFPTQSPICNGNDGVSSRLDGITFPKWRNESIKAGGNAVVPQIPYEIFKIIQQIETT